MRVKSHSLTLIGFNLLFLLYQVYATFHFFQHSLSNRARNLCMVIISH